MEEDDEFGDLYTDVLKPFAQSSSLSHPTPPHLNSLPSSANRPIDLNLQTSNDEPLSNSTIKTPLQNLKEKPFDDLKFDGSGSNLRRENENLARVRVLKGSDEVRGLEDSREFGGNGIRESEVDLGVENNEKFQLDGIEGGIGKMGSEPIIPGLNSSPKYHGVVAKNQEDPGFIGDDSGFAKSDDRNAENDDWDSDSEDDLQIVLNDNNHGPMAMDRNNGMAGSDDEDEDGDPLVIVGNEDQGLHHQPMEEQELGEEGTQTADGERKETGETGKTNGGVAMAPKIGYGNHGYHPFHSQFKYIRPGAAPLPGGAPAAPGGAPGQVRPLVNMGPVAGRGRGEWRPAGMKNAPLQKGFHASFGMPWGNNAAGRGFGTGLEFTLPSHRTIFDIDIDGFEEKPWKYPGIDMSDFFNFGLNEESWKEHCKQLEQHRLEATMQSKIRVYESGRAEQDYDPEMPPELAAATGIHDVQGDNGNIGKQEVGQSDLAKGPARVRLPLVHAFFLLVYLQIAEFIFLLQPTGRAIQVETGYGERLPSIDTRPPRVRDSDAIIEIILQDSFDDDSSQGNGALEQPDNDNLGEDLKDGIPVEEDVAGDDAEYNDSYPQSYNSRNEELVKRRAPPETEPGSRGQTPVSINRDFGTPHKSRGLSEAAFGSNKFLLVSPFISRSNLIVWSMKSTVRNQFGKFVFLLDYSHQSDPVLEILKLQLASHSYFSAIKGQFIDSIISDRRPAPTSRVRRSKEKPCGRSPHGVHNQDVRDVSDNQEGSVESSSKHNSQLSSPANAGAVGDTSGENKEVGEPELPQADGSSEMEREEVSLTVSDTLKDGSSIHAAKKQEISSRVEQPTAEYDDGDDLKATRSSENSKARSGSSRDYLKSRDGVEDEVIQEGHSARAGHSKKRMDEDEPSLRGKDLDGRQEMERGGRMLVKGREDAYAYRDRDPHSAYYARIKADGFDPRREMDISDGAWQRRDEDPHSRRAKVEEQKRRERGEDTFSRHRGKLRESERSEKVEHIHLRKQLDEGSWRGDLGSRYRDRDDNLRGQYENMDDFHGKRRKEEDYIRREHAEKEEGLHAYRESSNRRKRGRDDVLDQRKRDEPPRTRPALDDHHRQKDEVWSPRERPERSREREEWHRLKQSHEDNVSKREREEGRGPVRSGRVVEEKSWIGHARTKDGYRSSDKDNLYKDSARHSEQFKRRDRGEDDSVYQSQHREREDAYVRGNQVINEDRRSRQERTSTRHDRAISASDNLRVEDKKHKENVRKKKDSESADHISFKRSQDHSGHGNEMVSSKSATEQGNHEYQNRRSSKRHREDASSDDEQQDSRRGRSKLERWTSQKERDYGINVKSSSLKAKEIERRIPEESAKTVEVGDQNPAEKDVSDPDIKEANAKQADDRHLDTVAKLKKRSERFKLPMPGEDTMPTKKKEAEAPAVPPPQNDMPTESEVKQERPARKRRWLKRLEEIVSGVSGESPTDLPGAKSRTKLG
ncbi:Pre-mRNA polyadenylation factor Fip1 domain [Dillenia turbinata]|uniref:Pre-mRNA polyadenylation factor Fip1 domain n=1 Tax=Dillenia turbinata TaxID=194707 RepID=A0AAN8W1N9_9MAGN